MKQIVLEKHWAADGKGQAILDKFLGVLGGSKETVTTTTTSAPAKPIELGDGGMSTSAIVGISVAGVAVLGFITFLIVKK